MTRRRYRRHAPRLSALGLTLAAAAFAGCGAPDDGFDDNIGWADYAVTKVCGTSGNTLKGIDVSKWQATVDWTKVAGDGVKFGIARASDGLNYDDSYFKANWHGMKANGIVRGVYQFFRPTQDPLKQASFMLQKLADAGGLEAGDLPPVLDLEVTDGASPKALQSAALAWLQQVEAETGKTPIIYTAAYFAQNNLQGALKGYPLWIANYTTPPDQGGCPLLPDKSWSRWEMWQWSSKGAIAGVSGSCDVNVFDGDLAALKAFIAAHTQGTTPPSANKPTGALEAVQCQAVTGWAFDADTPAQPVTIELYVDVAPDQPGASPIAATADVRRNDLCTSLGSCNHGLSWIIPRAYRDGVDHTLYAVAVDTTDGTRHDLTGSGATFACSATGGDVGGPRGDGGAWPTEGGVGSDGGPSGDGAIEARGGCAASGTAGGGADIALVLLLLAGLVVIRRRR